MGFERYIREIGTLIGAVHMQDKQASRVWLMLDVHSCRDGKEVPMYVLEIEWLLLR